MIPPPPVARGKKNPLSRHGSRQGRERSDAPLRGVPGLRSVMGVEERRGGEGRIWGEWREEDEKLIRYGRGRLRETKGGETR